MFFSIENHGHLLSLGLVSIDGGHPLKPLARWSYNSTSRGPLPIYKAIDRGPITLFITYLWGLTLQGGQRHGGNRRFGEQLRKLLNQTDAWRVAHYQDPGSGPVAVWLVHGIPPPEKSPSNPIVEAGSFGRTVDFRGCHRYIYIYVYICMCVCIF